MVAAGDSAVRPPIVVLGIGGSGTRAIAEILTVAGVFLGSRLNAAGDSQVIGRFIRRWAGRYLEDRGWVQALARDADADLPADADPALAGELRAALEAHRDGIPSPGASWGWKNPRTVYLLPAVHAVAPGVRVVQLVRDGRDVAYSRNQNQLEAYGELIVGDLGDRPAPVRSAALWSRVNLAVLRCGKRLAPDRHLVVRYEDVCRTPAAEAKRLLEGLGLRADAGIVERAAALVSASPSAGRWRKHDPGEVDAVEKVAAEGLRRFGYLDG